MTVVPRPLPLTWHTPDPRQAKLGFVYCNTPGSWEGHVCFQCRKCISPAVTLVYTSALIFKLLFVCCLNPVYKCKCRNQQRTHQRACCSITVLFQQAITSQGDLWL